MEWKRRFIQNILASYSYGTFTPHLGIFTAELLSYEKNISTFKYKIPPYLCYPPPSATTPSAATATVKPDQQKEYHEYLPTSTILALFDEFSSLSTIISDKNSRGGVSIILSANNYQYIPPNTDVIIVSKSLKIGKTIGFSDIYMYDLKNNLLASGNHIKYLDNVGKLWNFFMNPTIFPYTIQVLDSKYMKDYLFKKGIYGGPPKPLCDINEIGGLYPFLNIQSEKSNVEENKNNNYSLYVQSYFMNPNKTFHGGAVAISAEECVRLANPELLQKGSRVKSMRVQYLSPMIGKLNISVQNRRIPVQSLTSTSFEQYESEGEVSRIDKSGKIGPSCAKFSCTWS